MLSDFPPLHPAIVHFPIALLLLAGIFGTLSLFYKREFWKDLTLKCLIVGVVFTPFAVLTGMLAEQNLQHNEAIHEILVIHKYIGFAILFLFQILLVWFWLRRKLFGNKEYVAWVFGLLAGNLLILYQGYLGGEMVYTHGAGVKAMQMEMGSENQSGHDHAGKKMEMNDSSKTNHDHNEKSNHSEESMKDGSMKGREDMKDSDAKAHTNMKGMDNKEDAHSMKKMKGLNMENAKSAKHNMTRMDSVKNTKEMSGMHDRKDTSAMNMPASPSGGDDMKNMKMPEQNAMDTIRFPDNNPALKKTKKPVKQ